VECNSSRNSLRNWKNSGTVKEQSYYGTLNGRTRKISFREYKYELEKHLHGAEKQNKAREILAKIGVKP